MLSCYPKCVEKSVHPTRAFGTDCLASPSFEELAAQQGVSPIDDFDVLFGEPSTEDETAEEFAANLRDWRREISRSGTK
jgi:hypothetical protein